MCKRLFINRLIASNNNWLLNETLEVHELFKTVRRDFPWILYFPRILNIPSEVVLAVIYIELGMRCFSSAKINKVNRVIFEMLCLIILQKPTAAYL